MTNTSQLTDMEWAKQLLSKSFAKVKQSSLRIGSGFPHVSKNGKYEMLEPGWWTAGFWPGLLWLVCKETGDLSLEKLASECEAKLDGVLENFMDLHHDVGFMWSLSSVANYKLTGDPNGLRRGLHAATLLAGRFNLNGRFIRAWNFDKTGWSIIDTMMNLPILYWASETTGDPRFRQIAMAHADTVIREFLRPDGSVNHVVCFDPESGDVTDVQGGQGFAPYSAWARGASWAIYGFALCYKYTQEQRYLDVSRKVADFFVSNLPEDGVPYWDFKLPVLEGMPKDSSAGACAASGMLELALLVPESEAHIYLQHAIRILKSLNDKCGAWDRDEEALLLHGTVHFPEGRDVDVPIIYGDYFFVEALTKMTGDNPTFW